MASADFPAAVGPAIDLVPRHMDDRRPTMYVVRGKRRRAERGEQRAHFPGRELVARLDRRLARDGRRESFVSRRRARKSTPRQRVERLANAALGVESWVRHWDGANDQRVSAKPLDLEAERREEILVLLERVGFSRSEVQRQWKQQALRGCLPALQYPEEALEEHALVRRVLVDEHKPVIVLEHEVRVAKLDEWRHGRVGGLVRQPCRVRLDTVEQRTV
jgi:hypothetical protein